MALSLQIEIGPYQAEDIWGSNCCRRWVGVFGYQGEQFG